MCRLAMLSALCVSIFAPAFARGDEAQDKVNKEAAEIRIKMDAVWKKFLSGREFAFRESDHLLLYGTVDTKDLDLISKGVEKNLPAYRKMMQLEPTDKLWPGKLVIHVLRDRLEFNTWVRNTEKRSPTKDEAAYYKHENGHTEITLGPPSEGRRFPLDLQAIGQVASAVLTKKLGMVSDWFVTGFGRSAMYRYSPATFSDERRRANALLQRGRTAKDVWTGNLSAEDGYVLNASLVDYLISNARMAKFWPDIINSFGEDTPFEDALKAAKVVPEQVDAGWRAWARTVR